MEATASGMHYWGSRGRRFKSGRPDWQRIFFEYSHASQEPTNEPSCCAMALPEACADRVPRRPYGACANTAEPAEGNAPIETTAKRRVRIYGS